MNIILAKALACIILGGAGNRIWGWKNKPIGAAVMALSWVVARPDLWMWYPVIYAAVYGVRSISIGDELDEEHGSITSGAIFRAWAFAGYPLIVGMIDLYYQHLTILPVIWMLICPIIAVFYWVSGRVTINTKIDPTMIAEIATGAFICASAIQG